MKLSPHPHNYLQLKGGNTHDSTTLLIWMLNLTQLVDPKFGTLAIMHACGTAAETPKSWNQKGTGRGFLHMGVLMREIPL